MNDYDDLKRELEEFRTLINSKIHELEIKIEEKKSVNANSFSRRKIEIKTEQENKKEEEIKELKIEIPKKKLNINFINIFGVISIIFATVIFFKIGIDNGWFSPVLRIILAYIANIIFISFAEYFYKKDYKGLATGLFSLSHTGLFLTTWFAEKYFHLINSEIAFVLYICITALAVVQALKYNSQLIGSCGILGGLLTPILASTGNTNDFSYIFTATYYLILNIGAFYFSNLKSWSFPKWLCFIATYLFLYTWSNSVSYINSPFSKTYYFIFQFIYFIYYSLVACYKSYIKNLEFNNFDINLLITNSILATIFTLLILNSKYFVYFGGLCALIAFVYIYISSKLCIKNKISEKDLSIFLILSTAFLCLAIRFIVPIKFVSIAWSTLAIICAYFSNIKGFSFLRFNYLAILFIIAIRLFWVDEIFSVVSSSLSLPTLSLLSSVSAYFYCLRQYELNNQENKLISNKFNSFLILFLWFAVLFGSLGAITREAIALSHIYICKDLIFSIQGALILISSSLLIYLFCKTQLKEFNLGKYLLISLFSIIVFCLSLNTLFSNSYYFSFSCPKFLYLILPLSSFLFLYIIFLLNKPFRTHNSISNMFFTIGILVLMLCLTRESYMLSQVFFKDNYYIYQIMLSVLYSLIALGTYIHGLLNKNKFKIYLSYILLIFVGLKIYLHDMILLDMIYRAIGLLIFGFILLICSFIENYLNKKQKENLEK